MKHGHKKLSGVEWLDKDEVVCCDEDVVAWLDEGVLACLDKNNEENVDVDCFHAHPLEYILEKTLGGKCLVWHGYMQKIGCYEIYVHFCYHHNYKNLMIYHDRLNDGRENRWYEAYIHIYQQH